MKYIVIQSFIGTGTWLGLEPNESLTELYDNVLIPSYARYCKRHNYKHVVYKEQLEIIEMAKPSSFKSNKFTILLYNNFR